MSLEGQATSFSAAALDVWCAAKAGDLDAVRWFVERAGVGVDDYASVLINGSAMQPIAASLGIHPLRLAWVVHGIGVAVPSIHPLSSWFGVQLALISEQVRLPNMHPTHVYTCASG